MFTKMNAVASEFNNRGYFYGIVTALYRKEKRVAFPKDYHGRNEYTAEAYSWFKANHEAISEQYGRFIKVVKKSCNFNYKAIEYSYTDEEYYKLFPSIWQGLIEAQDYISTVTWITRHEEEIREAGVDYSGWVNHEHAPQDNFAEWVGIRGMMNGMSFIEASALVCSINYRRK